MIRTISVLLLGMLLAACRTGHPYVDPAGPRYSGGAVEAPAAGGDTLLIVSFNVEFALRVDSAIAVLTSNPDVADADVVLLQEMDGEATERVARALGMTWVYYPAILSERTDRDFGNAILSRWPIVEDAKLVLPHTAPIGRTRRTATAATLDVKGVRVRVYSTHLGTVVNIGPQAQRDQFEAVLRDAARHQRVIIGGDMNTTGVGGAALDRGYRWPTREGPRTLRWGRWDHIFVRGFAVPGEGAAGTVLDNLGASDHLPVWAVAIVVR